VRGATNGDAAKSPEKQAKGRRRRGPFQDLGEGASAQARRQTAAILEVLAGVRTPTQAAEVLEVSLPRYYQLEARGLKGLLDACEPKPKGRQVNPLKQMQEIQRENERLRQDVSRQQTLVRAAQRAVGLNAPAPPAKESGKGAVHAGVRQTARWRDVAAHHVVRPSQEFHRVPAELAPHRRAARWRRDVTDLKLFGEEEIAERLAQRAASLGGKVD
jgi:hypothetical protein